jgi:hypothetical protein
MCNRLKNFAVTAAHPQVVGKKLSNRLTLRSIVAGSGEDIGLPFLFGRLIAFVAVGHHRSAGQRLDHSFHTAFHDHYYDSL